MLRLKRKMRRKMERKSYFRKLRTSEMICNQNSEQSIFEKERALWGISHQNGIK